MNRVVQTLLHRITGFVEPGAEDNPMNRDVETLTIKSCPLCGKTHIFTLTIERVSVRSLTGTSAYTLILNCPKTQKQFQVTVENTSKSKIESVEVIGVGNG